MATEVELVSIVADGLEQETPLTSHTLSGTSVVLVFKPHAVPEDIRGVLAEHQISSHDPQHTPEQTFLCLYLTKSQCESLAEEYCYHVSISKERKRTKYSSWVTRIISLLQYGSTDYNNFQTNNYSINYSAKLKDEPSFNQESLNDLYHVRVQAELIYSVLKDESILSDIKYKVVSHFVPHNPEDVKDLERSISWLPTRFPLKKFRDYFGEELAFVYAWSNFWWFFGLLPIAFVSLISLLYGLCTELNQPTELGEVSHFWKVFTAVNLNPSTDYYIGFLLIWINVFSYQWQNASPIFSIQWGVASFDKEEPFCEGYVKLRSTNRTRKLLMIPNFIISIVGFLSIVCFTILLFLLTEIFLRVQLNNVWTADTQAETTIIASICSLFYTVSNTLAGTFLIPAVSTFLTNLEGHKFESFYRNSVAFKQTGYYLISTYGYLAYLVFRLNTVISEKWGIDLDTGVECHHGICMINITQQLVIHILVIRLHGFVVTFGKYLWKKVRQQAEEDPRVAHDLQYLLTNYKKTSFLDPTDYSLWMSERVLMYGFIVLFSYHLPLVSILAALLETLVTYTETRILLRTQRPLPRRAKDMKQWEGIIYLINMLAVIFNAYSISMRIEYHTMPRLQQVPGYFIPVFILLSSLIHVQSGLSGDKTQFHLHQQYLRRRELVKVIEVDGDRSRQLNSSV